MNGAGQPQVCHKAACLLLAAVRADDAFEAAGGGGQVRKTLPRLPFGRHSAEFGIVREKD